MIKNNIFIIFLLLITSFIFAQPKSNITYYKGSIKKTENTSIFFILKTTKDKHNISSELYVPEQFLYAKKASETIKSKDSLEIIFTGFNARLIACIENDTIKYTNWYQAGKVYDVDMQIATNSDVAFLKRPQSPTPPFSYIEKEICIDNPKGNSTLCGTLTIPDNKKDYPLVILITGSGSQNRDEEIAGHKPFLVIADYLTRQGIAVFRYDDRGFAKSKGDVKNATSYDFMTDAESILNYFKKHPNINNNKLGILGHSEGGMIAWMLGARKPKDISFIITLAAPGVDIIDLMAKQVYDIYLSKGIDKKDIEWVKQMQYEIYKSAMEAKDIYKMRKEIKGIYEKYTKHLTKKQKIEYNLTEADFNMGIVQLASPWMKYFLGFKPSKYIKKIKCPVLALNGNKDIQVSAYENLNGIKEAINTKRCKNFKYHELEGLNHMFQNAENGSIEEYYYINETISPDVLKLIDDFIKEIVK